MPPDLSSQNLRPDVELAGPVAVSRVELALLAGILLLAVMLRFGALSRVAVEHFDEGVYASNLLFPDSGFEYPERHLYAPPLVPALSEWSQLFLGPQRWMPCLPGLVLGTLTVPLLWWIARGWFGPAAAVAAASLVACSEFHIGLSRSTLTDAPLLFFLLAAVGLGHSAVTRLDLRIAGLAGLVAGLAWLTKYNGWLSLAIVVSGSLAGWFIAWLNRKREPAHSQLRLLKDVLTVCGLMAIVAIAVWLPVWNDLQPRGGYAAVAANHRQYIVGVGGWWSSLTRHIALQVHFAGWWTLLGAILSVISAAVLLRSNRSTWNEEINGVVLAADAEVVNGVEQANRSTWNGVLTKTALLGTCAFAGAVVLSPLIVLVVWAITDWVASVVELRRSRTINARPARWFANWMCLAWIIGLLVSMPLYRPYPRLALLLMAAGWIGMSSAIVRLLTGRVARLTSETSRPVGRWLVFGCLGFVLAVSTLRAARHGFTIWELRTELADASQQVLEEIRVDAQRQHAKHSSSPIKGVNAVVYVYGEPAVFFHLAQPDLAVQPVGDLGFAKPDARPSGLPTYLAYSHHAEATPTFASQFAEVKDRLTLLTVEPFRPSEFVLLDDVPPGKTRQHVGEAVRVFRLDAGR